MLPDQSTPRWSFFHPRRARPPYVAAAHSPLNPDVRQLGVDRVIPLRHLDTGIL